MKVAIQKILLTSVLLVCSFAPLNSMEEDKKISTRTIIQQADIVVAQLTNKEMDKYRMITHDWQTLAPGALQIPIASNFEALAILHLAKAKEKHASKTPKTNINEYDLLCSICNAQKIDINKKLSYLAAIVVSTKDFNVGTIMKRIKDPKFVALMISATGILGFSQSFATSMGY